MTLPLDQIVFRTRALAQAHPFTPRAQSYFTEVVGREQSLQEVPEIGTWAGYAITVGYCLRKVEESDADSSLDPPPGLPADLDACATDIADRIRTERAGGLLLYPEPLLVDALDRIIAGEVERRLSHGSDEIDAATFAQLETYLAWWTIKGYALRIAEQLELEPGRPG
ncbi:MAG: hypothetical protein ABR575_05025 [Actinomycetota bacterium]